MEPVEPRSARSGGMPMVALSVVQRFRQHNDLRAYRRKIAAAITQSLAWRLLPALSDLPLEWVRPNGTIASLEAALAQTPRVLLAGPAGSGRSLALQQQALRWAALE